jgi:hypothetical protein
VSSQASGRGLSMMGIGISFPWSNETRLTTTCTK